MTDAAHTGYGVIFSATTSSEARALARGAETRGWSTRIKDLHTEIEQQELDPDVEETRQREAEREAAKKQSFSPGFLELFSGCARLCLAVAAAMGCWTEAWDIEKGPEFDLTNLDRLTTLFGRIAAGCFFAVHLAPPCATWSIARTPMLRSLKHIM